MLKIRYVDKYSISYSQQVLKNVLIINIKRDSAERTKREPRSIIGHLFGIVDKFGDNKKIEVKLEL